MLKRQIYKTTALTLAFLIFFTSVGFSFDVHYCQGKVNSISILGEAKSCHAAKKACPNHAEKQVKMDTERDCCSNQTLEFEELDSDFNISQDLVFSELEFKFITSFFYAFFSSEGSISAEYQVFKTPIPLVSRDIYALNEAYLL